MKDAGGHALFLFRRFAWSHWRRSPRTTLVLILILALGVAVFLSIRLANRAAISGFALFTETISGESDFVLQPTSGRTLPVDLLPAIRETLDPLPALIFPVLEANAGDVGQKESFPFQLVGVDLVALRNAAVLDSKSHHSASFEPVDRSEKRTGAVFISPALAESRGFDVDSILDIARDGAMHRLTVAGILPEDPNRAKIPENLLVMDLPDLQDLLGLPDQIGRIEIKVPPGNDGIRNRNVLEEILRTEAAGRWRVETPETRKETAAQMSHAFRLNLTFLSTLALLVGTYLILQALEAAVVRRRPEIAILRSLGVEPKSIRRAWLLESLALGAIGSLVGIALGLFLARFTVGSIARTVNTLYFDTTAGAASLDLGEALLAFGFGVTASLAAGWLPARDAARTPPAQALRAGARSQGIRLLTESWIGFAAIAAGIALGLAPPLALAGHNNLPLGGYLSALAWLVGLSILAGGLFRPLARWIGGRNRNAEQVYAASQLRRPTGRHRLAAAGLLVAIAMAAGMGILVHSFEGTLTHWIGHLLRADLYVASVASDRAEDSNRLPPGLWQRLAEDPDLEGFDSIRQYPVQFRGRKIRLAGADYHHGDRGLRMIWLETPDDPGTRSLAREFTGEAVPAWINEAFSRRFDAQRGDSLEIATPAGEKSLQVEGVYTDYSDEFGTVLVNRRHTAAWFDDPAVGRLAAYVKPGIDPERVRARWIAQHPGLTVRTNARLREEALRVFRQTFSVTHALEAIGIFVAVAGLGLALASLLMERRGDMTTLRSLGFTRRQLARASACEGLALAVTGIVGGLVLSLVLGWLLIHVINRQCFGWTLDYRVPVSSFSLLSILTLGTGIAVSAAVGYWGGGLEAEREE